MIVLLQKGDKLVDMNSTLQVVRGSDCAGSTLLQHVALLQSYSRWRNIVKPQGNNLQRHVQHLAQQGRSCCVRLVDFGAFRGTSGRSDLDRAHPAARLGML